MLVLVVDDSEESREIIEAALRSGGYRDIASVESSWQALKFLDVGCPDRTAPAKADVILLDIMLPEIDGIEVCTRIRADKRYEDTPIIMVTALSDLDSLAHAFTAGANDFIAKPLNRSELIARVRAALKLKAELDRRLARERELLRFLSSWGDRRAGVWIDRNTGLFVAEAAEAYLAALSEIGLGESVSVLALSFDSPSGLAGGDEAFRNIVADVARTVRAVPASLGAFAAAYSDRTIVVIVPEDGADSGKTLADVLQRRTNELASGHSGCITTKITIATGAIFSGADGISLLTRAIGGVSGIKRLIPAATDVRTAPATI